MFKIIGCINRTYWVIIIVKNKLDGFCAHMVMVYGSTYAEFKLDFINEMHKILELFTYHVLLGGDFNLVREAKDKSNCVVNNDYNFLLNGWFFVQ